MNAHLTDQQLIDYQFDLACEADSNEARTHLEQCEACRKRLHELARRLSALELLRDDVKASPELLSETIRTAVRANERRILLRRLPWLGAVAAAVVVGVVLLSVPERASKNTTQRFSSSAPSVATAPVPKGAVEEPPVAEQLMAKGDAARTGEMLAMKGGEDSVGSVRSVPVRAYADEETPYGVTTSGPATAIEEQPPFAPASAIELVVLPRREDVQLTIYNAADLTLVRERRNLTLKRGWNWLQFMWANTLIDPTSLALEPLEHKGQIEVQQLVFPPRLKELGRWLIHSEIEGPAPFELTYFTSGLSWRAFYVGTLSQDEKTMRLEGYIRVNNNSGEDYEDAQTRLVVGRVHVVDDIVELARREYPYGGWFRVPVWDPNSDPNTLPVDGKTEWIYDDGPRVMTAYLDSPKEIVKEGLGEYFLYTIEGTETIPNQWGKRLLSFEANDIPVASLCKYDEERWGTETIRFITFANDKDHKLGETPLPDGMVRVYNRADEQGHLSYVGGMDVKYVPVGEEVELELGPARLVEVKPVLMDIKTENHTFDAKGEVNGWDEVRTWKIEVVNAHTLPVEVEATRGFETAYWSLKLTSGDATYRKHDATHARFELTVPARQTQVFEYELTTYHGVREQSIVNEK